jgi:hypothetical protein
MNTVAQAGNLYGYTIEQMFWTIVAAAASTAHPHASTAYFNSEAVKCVDDFTIKPPGGANTPGGATVSQSNSYTYSFDDDNISAMINDRAGYFDISGNAVEMDPGVDPSRPIIFGAATYRQKALGLMKQMAPLYDGAGIQYGQNGSVDQMGYVVPPAGHLTDEWGLWYRRMEVTQRGDDVLPVLTGPIAPVTFYGPAIEITRSPDSNHMHVIGNGGAQIRISGNIHTDLQFSAP